MTSIDEINNSVQEYIKQITQVDEALKTAQTDDEKATLYSLRNDLAELLHLTNETLNHDLQQQAVENNKNDDDPFKDEFALFMSEMKKIDNPDAPTNGENSLKKTVANESVLEEEEEDFDSPLIGTKCSAPHTHTWGTTQHHNALICSSDGGEAVRVLFTNPTHQEMIPCSYYLESDCRFNAEKCRFSHGERVLLSDLRAYVEPNFNLLNEPRCHVLAKQNDKMWHKGKILNTDFEMKICQVRLENDGKEVTCKFEELFPIVNDSTDDSELTSDSEDSSDEALIEMKRTELIHKSLMNPTPNQMLGEWEKHTKGIGSKIMEKMGYITGTGLGQNGEGIIIPISAQILPPGISLDHCMNLREKSNGDSDFFSVDRKLKMQKRKEELKQEKIYNKEKRNADAATKQDLFNFLNTKILCLNNLNNNNNSCSTSENILCKSKPNTGGSDAIATTSNTMQLIKNGNCKIDDHNTNNSNNNLINNLKKSTVRNLNVALLQTSEDIKRKELEISRLNHALKRHPVGSQVYENIKQQVVTKTNDLNKLNSIELNIKNEQKVRKDKTKLTIF